MRPAGAAAREVEPSSSSGRGARRLTEPARPDGTVSAGEFRELVRDLHAEPAAARPSRRRRRAAEPPTQPEPARDPTADALPEDVVHAGRPRAAAPRGASKSREPPPGEATLMGMLAWVIMGLALWHYTIWLPDRFWGGIVGAFLASIAGAIVTGVVISAAVHGRRDPRPPRHAHLRPCSTRSRARCSGWPLIYAIGAARASARGSPRRRCPDRRRTRSRVPLRRRAA